MNNTIELGNKESIELSIFLAELANGVYLSRVDGKTTWMDAANFLKAAFAAPAAFNNIKEIPAEFKDWTPEEKQEVINTFAERLRFDQSIATEQEIEAVFQNLINLAKSVDDLVTKNEQN